MRAHSAASRLLPQWQVVPPVWVVGAFLVRRSASQGSENMKVLFLLTTSLQEKKHESISRLRIQMKTSHRVPQQAGTTFTRDKQSQTEKHGWNQRTCIFFYCSLICLPFRLKSLWGKHSCYPPMNIQLSLSVHGSILQILSAVKKTLLHMNDILPENGLCV